jgi:hypothetical protein
MAAVVNMLLTLACTGSVAFLQAVYKYRGTEAPNPLILVLILLLFIIIVLLVNVIGISIKSTGARRPQLAPVV